MDTRHFTFALRHHVVADTLLLEFHGELDAWADLELAPRVAALLRLRRRAVLVDLRSVTFLDAGGLRLLLRISEQSPRRKGRVRLVLGSPQILRVLRITRVDGVFTVLGELPVAFAAGGTPDDTGVRA